MTRRFDDMTLKVYQYFEDQYRKNPSVWIKRDDAILDLADVIPPGVATRFSSNYSPEYHTSLSVEQQIRRGRRQKLIAIMTSLVRNDHLEQRDSEDGNKITLRLSMAKRDPAEFGSAPVAVRTAPIRAVESLEDLLAPREAQPVEAISTFALYPVAKSDIAHKWQITHFIADGQPKIRAQYGNIVFEFSSSAADAFCDRITAQLIYARGELAQQQAEQAGH